MNPRDLAEQILSGTDVAHLATSDGEQPRVRPVNIAMRDGLKLWIASYTQWGKVDQLRRNPRVEVVVMLDSGAHVRIEGQGRIRESLDVKRRVLDGFPLMQLYFSDAADPSYTLIEILPEKVGVKDGWDLEYTPVPLDSGS